MRGVLDLRHKFNYPEDYVSLGFSSFAQTYVSQETCAEALALLRECRSYMEQDNCYDGAFVDIIEKLDKFLGGEG